MEILNSVLQAAQLYIFLCLYMVTCVRKKYKPVQTCVIISAGVLMMMVLEMIFTITGIFAITTVEVVVIAIALLLCFKTIDIKSLYITFTIVDLVAFGRLFYLIANTLTSAWIISQVSMAVVDIAIYILTNKYVKKFASKEYKITSYGIVATPILIYVLLCCVYNSINHVVYVYLGIICTTCLGVNTLITTQNYIDESTQALNYKNENILISQLNKHIERQLVIEQNNEQKMKELRHDMRHYDRMIKESILSHNYHQAIELIDSKGQVYDSVKKTYYCDNPLLNTLFNSFANQYMGKIEFDIKAYVPKKMTVDQSSLATVVSNLMENAVNATMKNPLGSKKVSVLVNYDKNRLIVEIKNPITEKIEYTENGLPVSKNGTGHGLGMLSVQRFIKKYKGVFDISEEEGQFVVRIFIKA